MNFSCYQLFARSWWAIIITLLSVAEILAKARGSQAAPPPSTDEPTPNQDELPENSIASEKPAAQAESPPEERPSAGTLPTTTAEKISWCRQHDAQ